MKTIAVSATGRHLEATVGQLFGRARFFILIDPDTLEWEVLDNLSRLAAREGIGIMTAKTLETRQVRTVLTGKCGAKALAALQGAGVEVRLNAKGTVRQALLSYTKGELVQATQANVAVAH
jgi:predicted Fe-Mo cluster-binding NifX family protein